MSVILNATTTTGLAMTPDNSGAIQFQSNGTNTIAITTGGAINASTQSLQTGGTTALYIDGSQNVGIGTTSPQRKLDIEITGIDYQFRIGDAGGNYYDIGRNTGNGLLTFNGSQAVASGYVFSTVNGERMRIDTSGNLLVGTTSTNITNGGYIIYVGSNAFQVTGHASGVASGSWYQSFYYAGTSIGQIAQNGTTSVSYNTSSDYRLKTNVTPLTTTQSGPVIDALKPSQFTWTTDNTSDVGFIAHEMQAVIPKAVTGEKDAVDANGNPIYQAVAVSSPEIIAYLVAELQSVRSRLAGLESTVDAQATEIATLKAKVGA